MLRAFRSSGEKPDAFKTPSRWPPRNVGACERTKELRIATGLVANQVDVCDRPEIGSVRPGSL